MFKDTFLDSKYNLIIKLGSGAYGCIYLSESKKNKRIICNKNNRIRIFK